MISRNPSESLAWKCGRGIGGRTVPDNSRSPSGWILSEQACLQKTSLVTVLNEDSLAIDERGKSGNGRSTIILGSDGSDSIAHIQLFG